MSDPTSSPDQELVPLPAGSPAPDFTLRQTPWLTQSLYRFLGRPIILVFFPTAFEPVSREQLMLYQEYLPRIAALHGQILGVAADHIACHAACAKEAGITFPLLADIPPYGRVSRLYGVFHHTEGVTGRAVFVVDGSGIIRFARAYPNLLNPGVDDLLTALEALSPTSAA